MRLSKTEKARDVLQAGRGGDVDLRDRRVLILADGKRTRAELIAMLGDDRAASIDRLLRAGYLMPAQGRDVAMPAPPAPAPAPASTEPPAGGLAPPAKRRSLAAAKMYLIDMLQLQRSPRAVALRLAIQATSDPAGLLDRWRDALAYLVSSTPPRSGERVHARFAEVVPEDALARLPAIAITAPVAAAVPSTCRR